MTSVLEYMKNLNWRLFVVGFVAGFIGMILTHGGIHLPATWNLFHGVSAASFDSFLK